MASLVGDTYRCLHTLATGKYGVLKTGKSDTIDSDYKDREATLLKLAETSLKVAYAVVTYFVVRAFIAQMPTAFMAFGAFVLLERGMKTCVNGESVAAGAGFWMLTTGIQQIAQATLWQAKALGVLKLVLGTESIISNKPIDFDRFPTYDAQSVVRYLRDPTLILSKIADRLKSKS